MTFLLRTQDVRCPIAHCNRARLQFLLSDGEPKYKREKYCDKLEGCAELRSTLGQQPFQYRLYCNGHTCQENGCLERHMEDFNVCENHKCNIRGCPAPKRHSRRFCDNHNRCGWNGCTGKKEENQDFCSIRPCQELKCPFIDDANRFQISNARPWVVVFEKRQTQGTIDVDMKVVENIELGCLLPKTLRGLYCETHTCVTLECGKERVVSDFCEIHYGERCRAVAREGWEEDRQRMEDERERNRITIRALDHELRQRDETINRLRSWNGGPPPN
ncbi:hypothetical protein M434DRAFT_36183 [Hypoxylon sp. CO27-5]|nr:hypothetical protein M434DRAFT_36183 [Hypoxylon sp. CO27-5]